MQPIFMRMREVTAFVGLKPHAIDRAIRAGTFPRPFLIGVKAKAWKRDEIDACVNGGPIPGHVGGVKAGQ
jgi:predicted DNA-binding transcriptional regulator AlpA